MHLKKVKLAGFKSFVDQTKILFKSNRTSVVGPNGCGKSNIIDAVRWVMGESSAKQLRGESMADVIFNGTKNRKPVGQAAVELFFDNTETMLQGEYAKYNEIAIRREVNRDGMSNYYLNGTRCRRKDIVDIFLGTGLGPRSYAIIEQGMISQLIEAKPDELRTYFEEAAGISKYKERRKETETRIRHTHENLERLNDIRVELESQLRHLKRQANAANRYKILKQEQRELKAQLQTLHWRTVHDQMQEQEANIKTQELALEAKNTEAQKVATEIEKLRQQQSDTNDQLNQVQNKYYSLGADIARIEQQIQYNHNRCSELSQNLTDVDKAWHELQQHIETDQHKSNQLTTELTELEQQLTEINSKLDASHNELEIAEREMRQWRNSWDNFNQQAAHSNKQVELEQTKINHLEQQLEHDQNRLEKLTTENLQLPDFSSLEAETKKLFTQSQNIKNSIEKLEQELSNNQTQLDQERNNIEKLISGLDTSKHELQKLLGKQASLETLQQTALGTNSDNTKSWLEQNKLTNNARLAQELKVDSGWETAVETVLSNYLDAVCVDDIKNISALLGQVETGSLSVFATTKINLTAPANALAQKVKSNLPITSLLTHIYTADSLDEAIKLSSTLKPYESIITKKGIWMGSSWALVNNTKDAKAGILQRERELKELATHIKTITTTITNNETELDQHRKTRNNLETKRQELQNTLTAQNSSYTELYGELTAKQTQLLHLQKRAADLEQEIITYQERITNSETKILELNDLLQQAETDKQRNAEIKQQLLEQQEQLQHKLQQAQTSHAEVKHSADELNTKSRVNKNQLEYLAQSIARTNQQLTSLTARKENIISSMKDSESPLGDLELQLQKLLDQRLTVENDLTKVKQEFSQAEHAMRTAENAREAIQQQQQDVRNKLEQSRMEWQALQVRNATYEEHLAESGFKLEQLLELLPEDIEFSEIEAKLEKVADKIDRLGPINLAAIDEYEQKAKRKEYLDAQNDDLVEALNTLEAAIVKIDHETKTRFKNTFEKVNSEFARLFPIVFGGGKAVLEMTENNLLETGIVIQAQPPGKRNATIHLLSGGEKALTAIALVFAIFQLNPAPFCMLDEVDAPLDDNNVVRFSNLVKEMSDAVQFIVVTHNKTTMELADQLLGVTMHEPGVSRIVSVDIDAAVKMAN